MKLGIEDYLRSKGVHTVDSDHHHVRSGWIGTDCPRCSPGSGKYRLGFEVGTGRVNCWNCGIIRGPDALVSLCRIRLGEAISVWEDLEFRKGKRTEGPVPGGLKIPDRVEPLGPAHRAYLAKRGFDPDDLARLWGLRGIGLAPKLAWRVFVPIHDQYGHEVSWTTRAIGEQRMRFVSASPEEEAQSAKGLLYGAHLARQRVVVVEGPADTWAIGPGAVGVLGLATTPKQIDLISRFPFRAICYDNSTDAQARAKRLCRDLAGFPGQTVNVRLATGEDPAEADPDELADLRRTFLG